MNHRSNKGSLVPPPAWFFIDGQWHFKHRLTGKFVCGNEGRYEGRAKRSPPVEERCPVCLVSVPKRSTNRLGGRARASSKSKKAQWQCTECGAKRPQDIPYCKSCAQERGYRKCRVCDNLFAREVPLRGGVCASCRTYGRKKAPGSESSLRTLSGGLPSLGKDR